MRSSFATQVYAVTLRLPDILSTVRNLPLMRRQIRDTEEQSSVCPTDVVIPRQVRRFEGF
jgi:hypothetical protein